jgi:hypothetical protein
MRSSTSRLESSGSGLLPHHSHGPSRNSLQLRFILLLADVSSPMRQTTREVVSSQLSVSVGLEGRWRLAFRWGQWPMVGRLTTKESLGPKIDFRFSPVRSASFHRLLPLTLTLTTDNTLGRSQMAILPAVRSTRMMQILAVYRQSGSDGLEKQSTEFRQITCYSGDRALAGIKGGSGPITGRKCILIVF